MFSLISFFVAIPSAVKVFNWTATLYKGSVSWDSPMLYALGFIGLFTIGGLTGLFLATLGMDIHMHDTYFIIAHFHYVMVGGAIFGYLGGLHYWWPKITGRMYPEGWAKFAALNIFVGFNLTFFPQFIVGYLGHAAALRDVLAGVPGLQRAVDRRRDDPRRRLPDSDDLLHWSLQARADRRRQPVGRARARVGDPRRRRRRRTSRRRRS